MKRSFSLLTVIFILAFLFVSCGGGGGGGQGTSPVSLTDAESVSADKASLTIGYAGGDSAYYITQNIILATRGTHGTSISWSSNNTSVINDTGTVTRPAYGFGDATVTLTATIAKGTSSDTRQFIVMVKESPISDAQCVAADKAALTICYATGDSASSVTKNITLATSGPCGTSISWSSDNSAVIDNTGKAIRPSYGQPNVTVDLTATITKGAAIDTKIFTLTVIAYERYNKKVWKK